MCLAILAIAGTSDMVFAEGWSGLFHLPKLPDCIGARACDDYVPKQAPCVLPVTMFACDDYQPKRLPCTETVALFTCDDYCATPAPLVCPK
jgi:hypothetical protein